MKFALNVGTHIQTSGSTYTLSLFNKCSNVYLNTLSIDRQNLPATEMLLIPQTSNFAVSLILKTKAVTECDLLSPRQCFDRNSQFTKKQNLSSKLRLAKRQYVINVYEKFKYI